VYTKGTDDLSERDVPQINEQNSASLKKKLSPARLIEFVDTLLIYDGFHRKLY